MEAVTADTQKEVGLFINLRWMEEILHKLIGGLSHYL